MELNNLNECIAFEVCIQNKKCYIISLYRSSSQTHDKFDDFLLNFEQVLCDINARNPFFVLITRSFSARTRKWWRNDTATTEGTKIISVTTCYGFSQIIFDPTHILPNSSLCIDLIFKNQPNLIIESGVYPSLHPNCHHHIVVAKLSLKLSTLRYMNV